MATRRGSSNNSITGRVGDLQRRLRYLEGRPSPVRLANQVVQKQSIAPRAIGTDEIELATITNDQIAADAVTNAKLGTDSVGQEELLSDSVGSSEILLDSVGTDELGIDAIGNENIDIDAITNDNMANNSVGTSEIVIDSVGTSEVSVGAALSGAIAGGVVGQDEVAANAVGSSKVGADAIGNEELGAEMADSSNISTDSIGNSELGNNAVGSANFGTDAVDSRSLSDGSVDSSNLGADSVGNGELGDGAVTTDKVVDNGIPYTAMAYEAPPLLLVNGIAASYPFYTANNGDVARLVLITGGTSTTPARADHTHGGSTRRIKSDISSYRLPNPQKILDVDLKKFKFIEKYRPLQYGNNWMYGYIAEEILDMGMEELLQYNKKGQPSGLNYGLVSSFSFEVIKRQKESLKTIRKDVEELKKKYGN